MKRIRNLQGLAEKSEETLAKISIASVSGLQQVGAVRGKILMEIEAYQELEKLLDK